MSQDAPQFSRRKTVLFSSIIITLFLVMMELGSYAILVTAGRGESIPKFHPLFREQSDFSDNGPRLFDPLYIYRLAPSQPYNSFISINAQGVIDNGHPVDLLEKKPETFRIVVFGGSTVAGTGASSNAGTIPAFLERKLRSAGIPAEVINAGTDGYTSLQQLMYFAADMVHHQPDLVIFYDGVNDFTNPVQAGGYIDEYRRTFHKGSFQEYGAYLVRKFKSIGNPGPAVLNFLRDNFYSAHLALGAARKIFDLQADYIPENVRHNTSMVRIGADEAARLYLSNVATAIGAARAHEMKVFYALQPTLLDKPVRTGPIETTVMTGDDVFDALTTQFWDLARNGFGTLGARHNSSTVCVADLSGVFKHSTEVTFTGGVHVNDRGNDIITDSMLPYIQALIGGTGCEPRP